MSGEDGRQTQLAFSHMKAASDVGGAFLRLSIFGALLLHILRSLLDENAVNTEDYMRIIGVLIIVFPIWAMIFFSVFNYIAHLILEPIFGAPLSDARERIAIKLRSMGIPRDLPEAGAILIHLMAFGGLAFLLFALCVNVSTRMLGLLNNM